MMPISQILRRDRSTWSSSDVEEVEYFFKCNKFYAQIYQREFFEQIVKMTYYTKVSPVQPVFLTDNKRSVVVVLLSGAIRILRKTIQDQSPRKRKNSLVKQDFTKPTQHVGFNETIFLTLECKIVAMHDEPAEILFIPSFMHQQLINEIREQKHKMAFELLRQIFGCSQKKPVTDLAESGCSIEEYSINNYVYRQGDPPQFLFVILQGSVKLYRQGDDIKIQAKQLGRPRNSIVSARSLLGDRDLCEEKRKSNAQCCSSSLKVLRIPKQPFLQFASSHLPHFFTNRLAQSSTKQRKSVEHKNRYALSNQIKFPPRDPLKLPNVFRYKASLKNTEEDERQYRLIRNSHILLDSSSPRSGRVRSRRSCDDSPKDIVEEKMKLFRKIRPNAKKFSLNNKII